MKPEGRIVSERFSKVNKIFKLKKCFIKREEILKMKKKIVSFMVAAVMTASLFVQPVSAAVVDYKDWSNVFWTTSNDGISEIPSQYSFTLNDDTKDAWGKTPIYQLIDTEESDGKKNMLIIRLESPAARGRMANTSTQWYDPTAK